MSKRLRQTLCAAVMAVVLSAASTASAAPIIYVDGGDHTSDYQNQLTLLGYGYTVFNSYDNAQWTNALANADVILVGERHAINANTNAATKTGLANFVAGGGGFVGHSAANTGSSMHNFMNAVFGTSLATTVTGCSSTNTDTLNAANAAGTPFAGGPATLDDPSCTFSLSTASVVSSGMKSIYDDLSGNTSVAIDTLGLGGVAYLGWDFCVSCSSAVDTAAWRAVLDNAIEFADNPAAIPEPASMLLVGSGLIGAGVRRYRRSRKQ